MNIHEAKTHLSRLIEKVVAREEVVSAKAGKPVVRLIAMEPVKQTRRLAFLKGQIVVPDDIKTPFADEVDEMFYSNPDKFTRCCMLLTADTTISQYPGAIQLV